MCDVFVKGFDFGTTEEQIRDHFAACGAIDSVSFRGEGAALVGFEDSEAANRAVEMDRTTIANNRRFIFVNLDGKGKGKGKGKGGDRKGGGGFGGSPGEESEGEVAKWNDDRGFGFIKREGAGDVFVHVNDLSGCESLNVGDIVQYTYVYDERKGKYRAENVRGGTGTRGGGGGYGSYGGKGRDY